MTNPYVKIIWSTVLVFVVLTGLSSGLFIFVDHAGLKSFIGIIGGLLTVGCSLATPCVLDEYVYKLEINKWKTFISKEYNEWFDQVDTKYENRKKMFQKLTETDL